MKIPADQLSDAELEALIALPALKQRESGGRPGVMGPQTQWGRAVGSTQMLPDTAKAVAAKVGLPWRPDLLSGTTPEAASYQDTLGHAYLTEGIAKTGSLEDGLRYYHGGPDRRQWGPKTEAYAKAVAANAGYQPQPAKSLDTLSNEELDALIAQKQGAAASAAPAPPVQVGAMDKPVSGPVTLGQMQAFAGVKPKSQAYGFAKGAVDQNVRLAEIAKSMPMFDPKAMPATAFSPGGMLANVLLQRGISAGKGLQGQVDRMGQGLQPGKLGEIAGSILGSAWLPGGVMTQGAVSGAAQSQSDNPIDIVRNGLVGAATGKVASKAFEGLGSIIAKPFVKQAVAPTLEQLKGATDAAYRAADNAGVRYTKGAYSDLVSGVMEDLKAKGIDEDLNSKVVSVVKAMVKREGGEPTLTSLDKMRQFVRANLTGSGVSDQDQMLGKLIIQNIDEFVAAKFPRTLEGEGVKGAAAIREARALNSRYKKVEAVNDAVEEARSRAARTGSGGNIDNTLRQELAKVLKTQRGLTPDERAAIQRVVEGAPVQNLMRMAGKLSPQGNGLMAALGVLGSAANPAVAVPFLTGIASKAKADQMTRQGIDQLIKLMSMGGDAKALEPIVTPVGQAIRTGAKVVARPMGLFGGAAAGLLGGTATAKPTAKPKPKPAK